VLEIFREKKTRKDLGVLNAYDLASYIALNQDSQERAKHAQSGNAALVIASQEANSASLLPKQSKKTHRSIRVYRA
jgi:hypothetical protein